MHSGPSHFLVALCKAKGPNLCMKKGKIVATHYSYNMQLLNLGMYLQNCFLKDSIHTVLLKNFSTSFFLIVLKNI